MSYTIHFIDKEGFFHFHPFIDDLTEAKIMYLQKVWWGNKSVRICSNRWDEYDKTIWETPVPVFPSYKNDNPTDDLPF